MYTIVTVATSSKNWAHINAIKRERAKREISPEKSDEMRTRTKHCFLTFGVYLKITKISIAAGDNNNSNRETL